MKRKFTRSMCCRPMSLLAAVLMAGGLQAQEPDRDKYDSLATKYKGQHAVYSNITEQLEISVEDGGLVANSHSMLEKLFISYLSLNNYNRDYFFFSDFGDLTYVNGYAYIPGKGKKYKKTDVTGFGSGAPRSYVFYDDVRYVVAYYAGITKNTVTQTMYSKEYPDVHMLPDFEFQDDFEHLPIDKITYEVVAPSFVKMNFVLKGEHTAQIKQTTEEKNGKTIYRFTATDMPAFKSFDNVPSTRYYMPHIIPYIVSFKLDGASKDSVLTRNTDDLYKYLYNYVRHKDMKLDKFLTKTVDQLVAEDKTPQEKAAHIYRWVQKNIHYIAFENGLEGFVPRPADTVYKRKYGDCKDMAAITVAMCRRAGLEAHFTWIGTDLLPYEHSEVPLNILFNHMICAVKINGEWVFVDGTSNMLPFGHNRQDIQGKEAMISVDENKYEIVKIPVESADANVSVDSTFVSIDGTKLTGSLKQQYKGYSAWYLGELLMYTRRGDEREKAIKAVTERGSNKYIQRKFNVEAAKTVGKEVEITADFVVDDYVHQLGKQCIVNLNLLRYFEDNHIDPKDRNVASYFDFKKKHKEVVVLEIPKKYKVTYLPPDEKKSIDGLWSYTISYKADKNRIILTKEYELNTLSITADKFADNNKMVEGLKKIYNEAVVLTTN